jgi:hypothetical protein
MTAEAGQPEVYPNLQVVLTRPIDWQVYHRLTLGHGSGRDDFETLKAITFLTSLLSSNQLPKSSFVRAARGTHAARVRHEPSGESMAPKGRRNAGITEFHGREQARLHFVTNRFSRNDGDSVLDLDRTFDVSMLSNSSTSFTFTPSDRSLRSISRRVGNQAKMQ